MSSRLVLNGDRAVIRQSGFWAHRSVLGVARHNPVSGKLIRPCVKTRQPRLDPGPRMLVRVIRHTSPHPFSGALPECTKIRARQNARMIVHVVSTGHRWNLPCTSAFTYSFRRNPGSAEIQGRIEIAVSGLP